MLRANVQIHSGPDGLELVLETPRGLWFLNTESIQVGGTLVAKCLVAATWSGFLYGQDKENCSWIVLRVLGFGTDDEELEKDLEASDDPVWRDPVAVQLAEDLTQLLS